MLVPATNEAVARLVVSETHMTQLYAHLMLLFISDVETTVYSPFQLTMTIGVDRYCLMKGKNTKHRKKQTGAAGAGLGVIFQFPACLTSSPFQQDDRQKPTKYYQPVYLHPTWLLVSLTVAHDILSNWS
jgi:hypothetical protein